MNNRIRLAMFLTAQFIVLIISVFIFGVGGAFFIAVLITSILIVILNQSKNVSRESVLFEIENAQQDLKLLEDEWINGSGSHFVKSLQQIKLKIADYKKLQQQSGKKMKVLREQVYRYRLDLYLSTFKIDDGKIPGIGQNRLERLKLAGVKSAADVEIKHLRSLETIGEATSAKLLEWRQGLERNFHFDPAEIPEAEMKRFTTEFVERRRGIEREIELLLGALRAGSLPVRRNQGQLQTKIETAAQRVWQAESDIKALGSGAAATATLIAVAFSTLLAGSIFEASSNLSRGFSNERAPTKRVVVSDVGPPAARPEFSGAGGGYRAEPDSKDHKTGYQYQIDEKISDDQIAEMSDFERRTAAETLHRESLELVKEKNYKAAENKLRFATRFIRYDKTVLNQLGYVLYERGKYSESLEVLFESLNNIDPSNIGTKTYVGLNYLALKDFEKARDRFLEVTRQASYSFDGNYNLGLSYKGLKNYSEAIHYFRKAATLAPEDADVIYQIALCLNALGDAQGVREQYEILLYKDQIMADKLKKEIRIK